MFTFFTRTKVLSSGRQLKELRRLGIAAKPGFEPGDYLKFREEAYIEKPYTLAMMALGGTNRAAEPYSDRIWHFHAEGIYATGDYVKIARRMRDLAGDELLIRNVRDRIDFEEGVAWLEFDLDGERIRWNLLLKDHWIDPQVMTGFVRLLRLRRAGKQYTYVKLGGRDCLIGCAAEDERKKLAHLTGLDVQWLE